MPDERAGPGAAYGQPAGHGSRLTTKIGIDTEELTGRTFPYQFDRSLVEDVDLVAATPGADGGIAANVASIGQRWSVET